MRFAAFIAANYAALYAVVAFILWDGTWLLSASMDERIEFLAAGVVSVAISATFWIMWECDQ